MKVQYYEHAYNKYSLHYKVTQYIYIFYSTCCLCTFGSL